MERRDFIRTTAAATAAPLFIPASALGRTHRPPPSDRVTVGIIGAGNQGFNNMFDLLRDERVQINAVCDVNKGSAGYWNGRYAGLQPALESVNFHYGREIRSGTFDAATGHEDFRDVIARDDVDALMLSLPDHWHAIPVVLGARAGRHMYGEKPLSLTIPDGRAMSDAVNEAKVVFQTGSQQRSDFRFRRACELVRNGRIGTLREVRCGLPPGTPDFGRTGHRRSPEPVPAGFNYDLWLGPAPERPYIPAASHVNFRWVFDYSGGQVTDWGGHHPDIAQWGMGTEDTGPIEIRNPKATFSEEAPWDTAVDYYFEAVYENGVVMKVSSSERRGVTFVGSEGSIWVTRGNWDASSGSILESEIGPDEIRLPVSDNHKRNWIDCILNQMTPVAPIEAAHRSISVAHLGNIAMRAGRGLKWNPETEEIVGDPVASAMLVRPIRGDWY